MKSLSQIIGAANFPQLKELIVSYNQLQDSSTVVLPLTLRLLDVSHNPKLQSMQQISQPHMNLLIMDVTNTGITTNLRVWYPKLHTIINSKVANINLRSMSCFENFHELAFKVHFTVEVGGQTISQSNSPIKVTITKFS